MAHVLTTRGALRGAGRHDRATRSDRSAALLHGEPRRHAARSRTVHRQSGAGRGSPEPPACADDRHDSPIARGSRHLGGGPHSAVRPARIPISQDGWRIAVRRPQKCLGLASLRRCPRPRNEQEHQQGSLAPNSLVVRVLPSMSLGMFGPPVKPSRLAGQFLGCPRKREIFALDAGPGVWLNRSPRHRRLLTPEAS